MCLTDYINQYADNVLAIADTGESVLYNEVNIFADKLSQVIPARSLVFAFASNSIASLVGYLAFQKAHIVPLMLSNVVDRDFYVSLKDTYAPNYLWIEVDKIKDYAEHVTPILTYRDYAIIEVSNHQHHLHEDLALLLSTSGSTGSAKLVRLSGKNILANALSIAEYLTIDDSERPITSLPMYYSYGISVLNSHITKGATILLTNYSVVQMEFWKFFKQAEATSIAGVPYTYEMLRRMRFERMNLPSLRTMTQAGGKLAADAVALFVDLAHQKGYRFFVMYGQTEATARMSYLPFDKASEKTKSIGIAIPSGQFELRNDDGEIITTTDTDGELYYTGDNVFMGYATAIEDLQAGDTMHGVLPTGDIARVDNEGYYYITGRKNRFVKIFGNRIGLDNVEQILKAKITECACVGDDNQISIFITQQPDFDVIALLAEKLHLYPSVFALHIIDEIPKSESGKVLYSKLKQ